MKNISYLAGVLAAGILVFGGARTGEAQELKVSGFVDIILTLMDEASDDAGTDSDGDAANSSEKKFGVSGEVDFEYTAGPVVARLDLDIPSSGNEAIGVVPDDDIGIEQAKFIWTVPGLEVANIALTAGAFNAPIGFEGQDAPDLYQITNGQLWGLVPSNLAGVMVSGGAGPVALDVYFANEWRANDAEENSIGGLLTITPVEFASVAVGYLTSPDGAGVAPGADGDGSILDVVASLEAPLPVMPDVTGLLVGEFLQDENNTGWAAVASVTHATPSYPHTLTVRFDSVDCDDGTTYAPCGGAAATPTSLTVAGLLGLSENLFVNLEWNTFDPDVSGADSTDMLLLEFIATLN
jgi:hypothetical protein